MSDSTTAGNGEVLFVRSTTDEDALYGVQADGSDRREIRRYGDGGAVAELVPIDISPEGRRLLWHRDAVVDGRARERLAVSNADGVSARGHRRDRFVEQLLRLGGLVADGLEIAYLAGGRLGIMAADGDGGPRYNTSPLPFG